MDPSQDPSSKHHHFLWQSSEPEPSTAARAPESVLHTQSGGVILCSSKKEDISPAC